MNVSKKEYNNLIEYRKQVVSGSVLTLDGLRFICEAYSKDPYKIGLHMLETLARLESQNIDALKC